MLSKQLRVIVVDDHHHVLEPIHQAIRKRTLPFSNWTLVHFDAHPDLAFPRDIPASCVFTPSALYDALDSSEAGIASFILPLAFAGHMGSLVWVKPPWANQMAMGNETFTVGEHMDNGTLGVTSHHSYFVDEGLYAPESKFTKQQSLHLTVCELPQGAPVPSGPFVLDICLDYFTTLNPFLQQFELACGADDTRVLCRIYGGVQFKNVPPTLCHADQLRHQHEHATSLDRVLVTQAWRQMDEAAFIANLAHVFPLYNDPAAMPGLFQLYYRMLVRYNEAQLDLVQWAAPCVDLPMHVNPNIEPMLDEMQTYLHSLDVCPSLITITTSQTDNYTPSHEVTSILDRTLAMLRQVYGSEHLDVTWHLIE